VYNEVRNVLWWTGPPGCPYEMTPQEPPSSSPPTKTEEAPERYFQVVEFPDEKFVESFPITEENPGLQVFKPVEPEDVSINVADLMACVVR